MGEFYLASVANPQLANFYEAMRGQMDLRVLSPDNISHVLSGENNVCLIYSVDVYPDNSHNDKLVKIQVEKLLELLARYVSNRHSFNRYFPGLIKCQSFCDSFALYREEKIKSVSRVKDFLGQIESDKPIALLDSYDINELIWMATRLRSTENYGGDNKLYLHYNSREIFSASLFYYDWYTLIDCFYNRLFFFFGEDAPFTGEYERKVVPDLQVDEIQEVVRTKVCNGTGYSGNVFLIW